MPKPKRLPGNLDYFEEAYNGDKRLVVRMFYRAMLDACMPTKKAKAFKREAFRWIFRETGEYSAAWWAEVADLEYLLCNIRTAILEKRISKEICGSLIKRL